MKNTPKTTIIIEGKRYVSKRTKTPYPTERECANKMIDDAKYQKYTCVHSYLKLRSGRVIRNAFLVNKKTKMVWDGRTKTEMDLQTFMKTRKIFAVQYFTYSEVRANMALHKRYGNWI